MGFEIKNDTIKSEIFIKKTDLYFCFSALKKKALSCSELNSWISISEVRKSKNFKELMESFRWSVQQDEYDNVVDIVHNGFKIAEEELLFKTIAPFVRSGSYVQYERESSCSDLKIKFDFISTRVKIKVWNKVYNDIKHEDEFVFNNNLSEIL